MALLSKPSSAARAALAYVTVGALAVVWTGIWFVYLERNPPHTDAPYYWCTGFLITGLTLLAIGLGVGRIGRAARTAELPPPEVTPAVANAEQTAAARAPVVAPVNPAAGVTVPAGPTPAAGSVSVASPG
jgi:hypothetical protein